MPILKIQTLPLEDKKLRVIASEKMAKALAKEYGCDERQVWVLWQEIAPGSYFEGGSPGFELSKDTHPPICELTCFEGKSESEIKTLLEVTAKNLTEALNIPGNIFLTYREEKSGKVIAGNGVIRRS